MNNFWEFIIRFLTVRSNMMFAIKLDLTIPFRCIGLYVCVFMSLKS